jgi:ABC-type polysaccharide/polyol phosphate transport system ATPase subunit
MSTSRAGVALRFSHVTKTFSHRAGRKLLRHKLADVIQPARSGRFTVLDDISFELRHGESLGLVGPNGAGKSTLLNLATGLALPDSGEIFVDGHVAAMLELGAGFHPDLTGIENLRVNAALLGMTRRQAEERQEKIIDFSGIREFINDPLRTYSSGMSMRLAFSIAVHSDPDVLLIDEVIGVGDQHFYNKCLEKIQALQGQGKTIVLASHSLELLPELCGHVMWLEHGRVVRCGPAAEVVEQYRTSGAQ